MNTIYDNTFVLGQTSATNFVAGPGIVIDEPSAGTVRIGNDETVLYETTASIVSNTSVNLSEPTTAFEKVRINFVASNDTKRGMWFEYNGDCSQFNTNVMRTDPAGVVQAWGDYIPSNNYSTLSFDYGRYFVVQKTSTSTAIGDITFYITKVVGINRKEV